MMIVKRNTGGPAGGHAAGREVRDARVLKGPVALTDCDIGDE